jgi:hypothetical protein
MQLDYNNSLQHLHQLKSARNICPAAIGVLTFSTATPFSSTNRALLFAGAHANVDNEARDHQSAHGWN